MTRTEFDIAVREMKAQREAEMKPLLDTMADIRKELAIKNAQIADLVQQTTRLKAERKMYANRVNEIKEKHDHKIAKFIMEWDAKTTSNLADAPVSNIIWELRNRGYKGLVSKLSEDGATEEIYDLSKRFGEDDNDIQK
jgi:hypothetical protein